MTIISRESGVPGDRGFTEIRGFAPALVINAHPDDESFGFGGTISLLRSLHQPVTVASLTRGEAGQSAIDMQGNSIRAVRTREYLAATQTLGVNEQNALLFDMPDGALADKMGQVESTIEAIIRMVQPSRVFTMHPLSTSHPDHLAVANGILSLREQGRIDRDIAILLQYLPHKYQPDARSTRMCVPISNHLSTKIMAILQHVTQGSDSARIIPKLLTEEHYVIV